jgi:hypothetical protein
MATKTAERTAERTDITSEVVTLDPIQAREWLDNHNTRNRPLNPNTVEMYARVIKDGRWKVTHQGIAFDTNGALIDGQHRLAAIALAGVPVRIMVTRNVDPDEFSVIDVGRRRTPADALGIAGIEHNRNQIASVARFLRNYDRLDQGGWTDKHTARLDNSNILDAVEDYGSTKINSAVRIGATHGRLSGINITVLSAFFYLLHYRYETPLVEVMKFIQGVSSGAGLQQGDARLALRNAMMHPKRSAAKTNRDRKNQLISVIKAWNAYISDREITRIIVRDTEEIPKFVTINSAPQK